MRKTSEKMDDCAPGAPGTLAAAGKLGFGLMRLPQKDGRIDLPQVCAMVDAFLAAGFTYFDTAWAYPGSEEAICKALVERHPRDSFLLATKMAPWIDCATRDDALRQFETSLARTGAGHFDFYLLHNLGAERTRVFEDFGLWDWALEQKAAGAIRHLGFSAHATPEELDGILSRHPEAEFVQLQINYADWEAPPVLSRRCLETARAHGKPVIVMEPVKGGMLAHPPPSVSAVLEAAEPGTSPATWALRFAADQAGVAVVLSGMSSLSQMQDNLAAMKGFAGLTGAQRAALASAREALAAVPTVPCTSCNYCAKVCPANVGIPGSFTALNSLTLYGDHRAASGQEKWLVAGAGKARASACLECGACEAVCPQRIAIREELKRVAEAFP